MEEDQYRATYRELTTTRCVFEKALTNNQAKCSQSRHFWLADREGYACNCEACCATCTRLLDTLRSKSSFVLKLRQVDGPLPHNMDIRVQAGGLRGIAGLVNASAAGQNPSQLNTNQANTNQANLNQPEPADQTGVEDVHAIISQAEQKYGSIEALPYSEIMPAIEQFEGRRRRQRKKD